MAELTLKSKNQILSAMIAKLLSETGLNDINPGSVVLTLLQLAATEDFQQYVQMLNIIRNYNLDTTTGEDLDARAFEYGLTRQAAVSATGKIDILRPVGFTKVSTSLYPGFPAPLAGDTILRVNDASNILYGTSGTLIIGRGTANEEEVTYSSAPTNFTNYWQFTVSSFSNDHTLDETVILKQGNDEVIPAGTLIVVPGTSNSPEISFTVNQDTTLLAGEDRVLDVEVTCTQTGTIGNIPIEAITGETAFSSAPFSGARAENNSKFTTGKDRETDDELRDRIKNHIQSLSRGTATAVKNAIVGALDEETAKRVVSANLIEPANLEEPVKIYIDDGTGFEPSFESQGFETVLLNSTGGEERVQLDLFPLVKAQIETTAFEPYDMSSGTLSLTYQVGLQTETINFVPQDFEFPNAATAEEIVALINDKATIIEARTSQVGKKVVIQAISDENEDIQVTGGSANAKLFFPTDKKSTLFLYVDDVIQSKDGVTAFVDSVAETYNFSGLGAAPWPLTLTVDGKTANPITINFVALDFALPAAATAEEVVAAINARLPGAVATTIENGTKVRIASNTELSSSSKIHITGGSANTVLGFSTTQVTGQDKDYTLNRELGQISFASPLAPNQLVTAGSNFTRAKFRTASPEFYTISAGQTLVVKIDGGSDQTITFSSAGTFSAQQVADIINAQLIGGSAYVREVGTDNYLEVSTNSYALGAGSILINSSSTAAALDFTYNTTAVNQRPHRAFAVSTIAGSYTFVEEDNLVVVIDDDPATKTFNILMDFDGAVTASGSTTVFTNATYNTVFTSNNILNSFYVVMKTGPNTTTGNISDVTNPGGSTYRYIFSTLPTGLANYNVGDHINISGLSNLDNNGNFIITAVNTSGSGYIEVTNPDGVPETLASGSALLGQRRQVSAYNGATGQITVGSAFSVAPAVGNQFIVLPSTLANVVSYLTNEKVTSLSRRAYVEECQNNTQLQISSKSDGSDGYVQVTGGSANLKFGFSTTLVQGLQGYNYYTGLLKLVHKIVYGDDTDQVTYPGVGAAGITFQILAPTVKEISINVNVTLKEGVSISSVEEDLKSEISAYVNGLGVGEDVIVSEIIDRVMGVDNITDVEVIEPSANIAIQDNEIARTKSSLILIG